MPVNGLVEHWQTQEFTLSPSISTSSSGVGDPTYSYAMHGETNWVVDEGGTLGSPHPPEYGVRLDASSSFNGTSGLWEVKYTGPNAEGGWTKGGAIFRSSCTIKVLLTQRYLYTRGTGSLPQVIWSETKIYVDGVLEDTLLGYDSTGYTYNQSGFPDDANGCGPNYIPIDGMEFKISGSAGAGRANEPTFTYDPCDPSAGTGWEWHTTVEGVGLGGWRYQELDGTWVAAKVTLLSLSAPAGTGCPYGLSTGGVIATSTSPATIPLYSDNYKRFDYDHRELLLMDYVVDCVSDIDPDDHVTVTLYGPSEISDDPCTGGVIQAYNDIYKTTTRPRSHSGAVRLVPDMEAGLDKICSNYRARLYRLMMPYTKAYAARTCVVGGVTTTASTNPTIHPSLGATRGDVGPTTHSIESYFAYPAYAPFEENVSRGEYITYDSYHPTRGSNPNCPPSWGPENPCGAGYHKNTQGCHFIEPSFPSATTSESVDIIFPSEVEDTYPDPQYHLYDEPRYLAKWCNKMWHIFYDAYPSDVDYTLTPFLTYWGPIREQANSYTGTKTRNYIVASPFETDQGNSVILDNWFLQEDGNTLRWIGISRFRLQEHTLLSNKTLSEEFPGAWSVSQTDSIDDATLTSGSSGITVSSFTGTTADVDLDLGSWSVPPYMLLYLAKTAKLDWTVNAGSPTIAIRLVGIDGTETDPSAVKNVAFTIKHGGQSKYAWSGVIDNGALVITDTGSDSTGDGISASIMSDPETVLAFELGGGGTYKAIRFKFTGATGANVLLKWPVFTLWDTHPTVIWESGKCAALLWPNGPGIRWGQLTWYDGGFVDPPEVTGLGVSNTMLDAICWGFRVFDGSGSFTGDITTRLSSMLDTIEVQSIASADQNSGSFILPKSTTTSDQKVRFALVSSYSEIPPLAAYPHRKRDKATWQATGDPANIVIVHDSDKHSLISNRGANLKLYTDADVLEGAAGPAPAGWHVWCYSPTLDQTETGWKIKQGTTQIGECRPWRGFFGLYGATETGTGVHACWSPAGLIHVVAVHADAIRVHTSDFRDTGVVQDVVVTDHGLSAQICWTPMGEFWVVFSVDDSGTKKVYYAQCDNGALGTFGAPVFVAEGSKPWIAADPVSGDIVIGYFDGSQWAVIRRINNSGGFSSIDALTVSSVEQNAGAQFLGDQRHWLKVALPGDNSGTATIEISYAENRLADFYWTNETPRWVQPGTSCAYAIDPLSQIEYVAFQSGAGWKLARKLGRLANWEDLGLIGSGFNNDDVQVGLTVEQSKQSDRRLVFVILVSDIIERWASLDRGVSWTQE